MNKPINILIIENEPIILDAILNALECMVASTNNLYVNTTIARNYNEALNLISRKDHKMTFNMVMLNIDIPTSHLDRPIFAEELGVKIKTTFLESKFIVFGSHCDNYRINAIFKKLKPEGFFIKSDIDCKALEKGISLVLSEEVYYSATIMRLVRRRLIDDVVLDHADQQILYFLSQGIKTKDLPKYVYLSDAGIQRRKRRLKEVFDVQERNDMKLLKSAEERGFI